MPRRFNAAGVPLRTRGVTSPIKLTVRIGAKVLKKGTAAADANALRSKMAREANRMGDAVVARAKRIAPVDLGRYRDSIKKSVKLGGFRDVTLEVRAGATYSSVIEGGRRAGARMPPVAALVPWVRRKFGLSGRAARSAAFAVARKIHRRGIRAKNVLARAIKETARGRPRAFAEMIRSWRRERFGIGVGRP